MPTYMKKGHLCDKDFESDEFRLLRSMLNIITTISLFFCLCLCVCLCLSVCLPCFVQSFKLRTLHLPGKCLTTELYPQPITISYKEKAKRKICL